METYRGPARWRAFRVAELRRLVEAGLYPLDAERIARALVSRARRTAAVRLDVQRPG